MRTRAPLVVIAIAFALTSCAAPESPPAEEPATAGLENGSFRATLNGFDIHYEVHGNGPVLMVLTNSWGLSLEGLRAIFAPLEEKLTLVYFDPRGEARGYCLYKTIFDETLFPESPQIMDVFDFVWLDMDAYRGLWRYLGSHDLVDRIRFDYVAEDDPAPNLFLEPRRLRRKTGDGVWMRVVDVADALAGRGYDQPGEAVIEITGDELCPWNNGCYRLSVSAGGEEAAADVERLNGPASPDLAIRPEGIASLVSGHSRASDLARMGRAAIPDEKQAASLDALFATRRRPHCPNMF